MQRKCPRFVINLKGKGVIVIIDISIAISTISLDHNVDYIANFSMYHTIFHKINHIITIYTFWFIHSQNCN